MVFGYHKWKRGKEQKKEEEKAEAARLKDEKQTAYDTISDTGLPSTETIQEIEGRTDELSSAARDKDKEQRLADRTDIEESINRDFEGMSEEQKLAMQETANRQIRQDSERSNRQLQSEAGQRGYVEGDDSLKLETARLATEAQGQFSRDLAVMDADIALQKLTTALILEESHSADRLLMDAGFRDMLLAMMDKDKEEKLQAYYETYD
ncbi:MAG: hypothetical protein DRN30_04400 [Thermoplasmata archaeon]|nr:MAG: hypothetical protein DRN30_04400 [Thermoplasmata archaeon]